MKIKKNKKKKKERERGTFLGFCRLTKFDWWQKEELSRWEKRYASSGSIEAWWFLHLHRADVSSVANQPTSFVLWAIDYQVRFFHSNWICLRVSEMVRCSLINWWWCNVSLDLLGHVDEGLVVVEPKVVVGHAHLVKGDLFGIFEKDVGAPDILQPADVEDSVLLGHVLRQSESMVPPTLGQEDVGHISLITSNDTRFVLFFINEDCQSNEEKREVINEVPWIPRWWCRWIKRWRESKPLLAAPCTLVVGSCRKIWCSSARCLLASDSSHSFTSSQFVHFQLPTSKVNMQFNSIIDESGPLLFGNIEKRPYGIKFREQLDRFDAYSNLPVHHKHGINSE